jgi:hypothetical protein
MLGVHRLRIWYVVCLHRWLQRLRLRRL